MNIETSRFGEVEIDENQIFNLPGGMLGFSAEKQYVILDEEDGGPFQWFQSIDNPELAFVMLDPGIAISDYTFEVSVEHLRRLEAKNPKEISVRVLITMTPEFSDVTVNLQGPLLFNMSKLLGLQLVIPDGRFTTRHPLFGDKLKLDGSATESAPVQKAKPEQSATA